MKANALVSLAIYFLLGTVVFAQQSNSSGRLNLFGGLEPSDGEWSIRNPEPEPTTPTEEDRVFLNGLAVLLEFTGPYQIKQTGPHTADLIGPERGWTAKHTGCYFDTFRNGELQTRLDYSRLAGFDFYTQNYLLYLRLYGDGPYCRRLTGQGVVCQYQIAVPVGDRGARIAESINFFVSRTGCLQKAKPLH